MDSIVDNINLKHREEVADLIKEHEELMTLSRQQAEVERTNLTDMWAIPETEEKTF